MFDKALSALKRDMANILAIIFRRYKRNEVSCHSIIEQFDHYIVKTAFRGLTLHSLKLEDNLINDIISTEDEKIVLICERVIVLRKIVHDDDVTLYVGDEITTDIFLLAQGLSLKPYGGNTKYVDVRRR